MGLKQIFKIVHMRSMSFVPEVTLPLLPSLFRAASLPPSRNQGLRCYYQDPACSTRQQLQPAGKSERGQCKLPKILSGVTLM